MAKAKIPHKLIPTEEREMSVPQTVTQPLQAELEVDEESFDKQFWLQVVCLITCFGCFLFLN